MKRQREDGSFRGTSVVVSYERFRHEIFGAKYLGPETGIQWVICVSVLSIV